MITSHDLREWFSTYRTTLRLAASYLVIIMIMSISFSLVLYNVSDRELGRQVPPDQLLTITPNGISVYQDFFTERLEEGRANVLHSLLAINAFIFISGTFLSYALARRTLEPIEQALDAQTRFAADASHELRTPLATMQTETEVGLRDSTLTLARAKALLRSNIEEVTHMRDLTDGLLRLARNGNAVIELQPLLLRDAAVDAIAASQALADRKHIRIVSHVSNTPVLAEPQILTQLILIILDNAIKYSGAKKTVTITAQTKGREVSLRIRDEGVGIAPEDLPHIFERFYRADPARSKQRVPGHGLGLALAQVLAHQLNGRISVSSSVGKGSTLTIHLLKA